MDDHRIARPVVLGACLGSDRMPTAEEWEQLPARVWREIRPGPEACADVVVGSEVHLLTVSIARAAVPAPSSLGSSSHSD